MILTSIDKGLSPVAKKRKFDRYSKPYVQRLKAEGSKPASPANLTVTGSMLSYYESRPGVDQMTITLGIHSDAPEIEKIKAKAHNLGTKTNIPERRHTPLKGEAYTAQITLAIRKLFSYCLNQAINRGRNK